MYAAPSLHKLQTEFAGWMLGQHDSGLPDAVAGNGLAPEARLQIYRNVIFNNLTAALRTAYPSVLKLVGEAFFEGAAARYICDCSFTSGNLQDFGAQFADCLASLPEGAHLPYLADVARLEWARQLAYLAADTEALKPAALTGVPENAQFGLRLGLHSSVHMLESDYPLLEIWEFCQREQTEHLRLRDQGQRILIWRTHDGQIAMQPLLPAQFAFLQALQAGETLAEAHDLALRDDEGFDLGDCLCGLFGNRLISAYALQ
jgi:hypothetical protein